MKVNTVFVIIGNRNRLVNHFDSNCIFHHSGKFYWWILFQMIEVYLVSDDSSVFGHMCNYWMKPMNLLCHRNGPSSARLIMIFEHFFWWSTGTNIKKDEEYLEPIEQMVYVWRWLFGSNSGWHFYETKIIVLIMMIMIIYSLRFDDHVDDDHHYH